jgi:hypothetical protein
MAEEGTLEQARTSSERYDDDEPSKQELQRRMEEARETITQTVTEIKETVTNQYYSMKETVSEALDWRHHFRKNPVVFSLGALSAGFLLGYGLAGSLKGDDRDRAGYPSSDESDVYARMNATPPKYEDARGEAERRSVFHGGSFAAQPITDGTSATSGYERATGLSSEEANDEESDERRSQAGGSLSYIAPRSEREQTPEKPGLFDRFKETSAYERLQTEVSTLGDRFIDELSTTAQTVVLPALFNKIKELFGVDLSGKQGQQSQGGGGGSSSTGSATSPQSQANTGARAASASASPSASASLASASRGSSDTSYATSENRGYGAQSNTGDADKGGEGSSVLDLDR